MIDFNAEIKSLSLSDIAMDVDYCELGFLQNHMMHEVNRMSTEEFVQEYEKKLEEIAENNYEYNLGVGILKKISGGSCSLEPRSLEKYVVDARIVGYYVERGGDVCKDIKDEVLQDMNDSIQDFVPELKRCGILFISFDEAM